MAQTNFTPILLYASSTPTNVPLAANLTNSTTGSEIAINVADKNLFFKDSTNAVNTVPIRQSSTSSDGWLSSTDWNTFNGKAPATSGTSILYGNGSGGFSNVTIGSGITFAGGTLSATGSGGTVTSVTGTSPVVSSGGTTPAISLATAYGDTLNPYASKTANYILAAPNGSAGVPTFRALVAADLPSLSSTYIPYTGATTAVDLNAKSLTNVSNLGVGTTVVPTIKIRAIGDNNSSSRIAMRGYSSDANSSAIRVTKFRGTTSAPQAPQSGDSLGKFELAGYGTTSSEGYPQASLEGVATEAWGAVARGTKALFYVTPNTTTTQVVALTIDQDKSATFASTVTANGVLLTGNTGTVTSVAATAGTGISVTGSPITTSGTLSITNTAPDQTVVLTAGTGISTSGTYPNFTITNTSPSSGGTVTSVTGTSPVVSSGGNTPAISMPAATTSVNGYLTSTDWNTFNGKGSVTSVSVVSANGFAGTVATATTTPAITISTSITGILKGNATAISAATSGTDYAPGTSANTSGLVYSTTTTGALTTATGAQISTALGSTAITGNAANVTGIVVGANGGTGVANTGSTITLGGSLTYSGAYTQTWTRTANTSLTLPISGTVLSSVTAPTNNPVTGTPSSSNYLRGDGTWASVTATTATNLAGGALGSIPYQLLSGTTSFLAGNTTTTPQFLTSTGVLGVATAPTYTGSTGSGNVVLDTSPTLVTPALGTPASGVVTNLTGTASININGTVGATTANTGAFTTATANSFIPNSATIPTNGMFLPTTNTVGFSTASTERMRIDANGRLTIGNTSPDNTTQVFIDSIQGTGNRSARFQQGIASGYTGINAWSTLTGASDNTSCQHFGGYANGGAKFAIYGNGNMQNTNNSYGALSDVKLKENIVDATPKLDALMQVKVRNYNLISDKKKNKQIGVIAQEVEQIFPALVEETPDRDEEGNVLDTTTKQVKYSVFVPMLIKAIQELNAKVEAQATEINTMQTQLSALAKPAI